MSFQTVLSGPQRPGIAIITFLAVFILISGCGQDSEVTEVLKANEITRHYKTIQNINLLNNALLQHTISHPEGGVPPSGIENLKEALHEMDAHGLESALVDGWGNKLIYERSGGSNSLEYRIISFGADGERGPDTGSKVITNPDVDIICESGVFVQGKTYTPPKE